VQSVDDLICAALRGERPAWPVDAAFELASQVQSAAQFHGVVALLHECTAGGNWPRELAEPMRDEAMQQTMWELRHHQVLAEVLDALAACGVRPIVIKGTALAYSLYGNPVLRSRADTDLFIAPGDRRQAHEVLASLGFAQADGMSGEFVSYQVSYLRETSGGLWHSLDVHWKINNSEVLAGLLTYDELRAACVPLPGIAASALGACAVHALLIACMHRCAHKQNPYYVHGIAHYESDRLIWLYDIHLLGEVLTESAWADFVDQARAKSLRAVCLDGLALARSRFHTRVPEAVLASLGEAGATERPYRYLWAGKLRQQWMDFAALGTIGKRLAFIRELLFPPASYMRGKYPQARLSWLPWLHARRICAGAVKNLRRTP
jgi:hypothetical protein